METDKNLAYQLISMLQKSLTLNKTVWQMGEGVLMSKVVVYPPQRLKSFMCTRLTGTDDVSPPKSLLLPAVWLQTCPES